MKTNVKTTGGGAAQPENTEALRLAYCMAHTSSTVAMENLERLRDLFTVIGSLAKSGDLESISIIAADGVYHAEDWHNSHDCEREELENILAAFQSDREG